MKLHCFPQNVVFQRASEFLLNSLKNHQDKKTLLLLSGGSAVRLYERIKYYVLSSKYENLAFAQIDDRYRPNFQFSIFNFQSIFNNQNINATQIGKTGLWESCERKGIPYYLVSQEGNLQESAEGYNKILEKLFKEYTYKIGVLGIGEDGHTAGLLPGYEKLWNKHSYVVGYDLRQNGPRGPFCPGGFPFRISLTPIALSQLDFTIVVVAGEKKRDAIKRVLDPVNLEMINKYPAAILQKMKKVDLFTDVENLNNL